MAVVIAADHAKPDCRRLGLIKLRAGQMPCRMKRWVCSMPIVVASMGGECHCAVQIEPQCN